MVKIYLLWFIIYNLSIKTYEADVLKIGAIFDKTSPYKEKAFLLAIDDANDKATNDEYEFEGIIKKIEYDDSFQSMNVTCTLIQEGVVGILGPVSEDNSNVMQSILDLKEIPHIDVRWDDQPLNGTVVNVYPYPDVMTRVYLTILNEWQWESFVILYENNESLFRVAELLKLFHDSGSKIVVRQLDKHKTGNYRSTLKEVWRSGATHFMLDCSIDILEAVLRQAQQIGLMTSKHHYIITNLDLHTFELTPFTYSETNITGLITPETKTSFFGF
ncbi:unnamed protein product [Brassicogethes aeneus]|uniref:Receptor ligand binding region domain-containing protein n=1 Tax=Brassicogethes aeneus TaxID=1431903 RepID=A0A9P0BCI6_BRAAE|nr:unnamed protein product [Brassicogethes aeneus]